MMKRQARRLLSRKKKKPIEEMLDDGTLHHDDSVSRREEDVGTDDGLDLDQNKMAEGVVPQWCLVDRASNHIPLPHNPTLVHLGREDCEITLQSRSVSKRHAVLTYDPTENRFKVKDLGSSNGTFVNDTRIPEKQYMPLQHQDTLRFGFDPMTYHIEKMDPSQCQSSPVRESPTRTGGLDGGSRRTECSGVAADQGIHYRCSSGSVQEECTPHQHQHQHPPPAALSSCAPPGAVAAAAIPRSASAVTTSTRASLQNGHTRTVPESAASSVSPGGIAYSRWQDPYHPAYQQQQYPADGVPASTVVDKAPVPLQSSKDHVDYLFSQDSRTGAATAVVSAERQSYPHDSTAAAVIQTAYPAHAPHSAHDGTYCQVIHHLVYPHPAPGQSHAPPLAHTHPPRYIYPPPSGYGKVTYGQLPPGAGTFAQVPPSAVEVVESQAAVHTDHVSSRSPAHPDRAPVHHVYTTTPVNVVVAKTPGKEDFGAVDLSVPSKLETTTPTKVEEADLQKKPEREMAGQVPAPPAMEQHHQQHQDDELQPAVDSNADIPSSPQVVRRDQRRSLTGTEADLKTVHQGTPLYGQPKWWGEEGSDNYSYPHTATLTTNNNTEGEATSPTHPTSLAFEPNGNNNAAMDGELGGEKRGAHTPPERDPGPGTPPTQNGVAQKVSPMAFTVDFGGNDEKSQKFGGVTDDLSQFLPVKVRRSFRERSEKNKERKEKEEKEREQVKKAEGNASPTRRRKSQTVGWTGGSPSMRRRQAQQRENGYKSDGHNSALSSDNEDFSTRSDTSSSKGHKLSQLNRSSPHKTPPGQKATAASRSSKLDRRSKEQSAEQAQGNIKLNASIDSAVEACKSPKPKGRSSLGPSVPRPTQSAAEPFMAVRKSPRGDVPDNTSETGTYTIDEDAEDVSIARESIDQVFGVGELHIAESQDTDHDVENEQFEDQEEDEWQQVASAADSLQVEAGSSATDIAGLDGEVHPTEPISPSGTPPQWAKQWEPESGFKTIPGEVHITSRDTVVVTQQVTQRRPASGRRLPSPPGKGASNTDTSSPRTSFDFSQKEAKMEDVDETCGRTRATVSFDTDEGGKFTVSFDAPQRRTPRDDETFISDTTVDDGRRQSGSARSVESLETDILLKDTECVVKTMSERILPRNPALKTSDSVFKPIIDDTDSDASSTACVIDGDMDTPRTPRTPPPAPRGNRPRLTKTRSTDKSPLPRTTPTKRGDSYTSSRQSSSFQRKERAGSSSSTGRSDPRRNRNITEYESDGYTDSSSIVSTDYSYCESLGSPKMTRKASSSKGKTLTVRPTRTFELRRSRTEDSNDTETSTALAGRSRPSSAGGSIGSARANSRSRSNSRTRPSSGRDSSRTAGTDRSEVSLGQKIVKKSRDNAPGSSRTGGGTASKNFVRGDGGRHSLRASQQPSLSGGSSGSRPSSNTRRRENTSIGRSAASPRSPGLSVTGNRPVDHGSSSPRSAEASAWKRRKDYDPRKAVADAKSGSARRDLSGPRHGSTGPSKLRSNRSKSAAEEQASGRRRRRGLPDSNRSQSSISSEELSFGDSCRSSDVASLSKTVADDLNALTKETESETESFWPSRRASSLSRILSTDLSGSAFSIPQATAASCSSSKRRSRSPTRRTNAARSVNAVDKLTSLGEGYEPLMISSIQHLAEQIRTHADSMVNKLRESRNISRTPSPVEAPLSDSIPEELRETVDNLRKTQRSLQAIDKTLFPQRSSPERAERIERIRPEVHFEPIQKPVSLSSSSYRAWRSHPQKSNDSSTDPLEGSDYY